MAKFLQISSITTCIIFTIIQGIYSEAPTHGCEEVKPDNDRFYEFGIQTGSSDRPVMKQVGATLYFYTSRVPIPSLLFTSTDGGMTIQNQTSILNGSTILDVVTICQQRALVILYASMLPSQSLIMLSGGGKDGNLFSLPKALQFKVHGEIHSHPIHCDYLAALGEKADGLPLEVYISTNMGMDWKPVITNATDIRWDSGSSHKRFDIYIYMLVNTSCAGNDGSVIGLDLVRTAVNSSTFTTILHRVKKFMITGKYMLALVYTSKLSNNTVLKVSISQGRVWNTAHFLESVEIEDFFSLDNPEKGLAFLQVKHSEGSKTGTLYIPDADGLMYTRSLSNHKLPDPFSWSFKASPSMLGSYLAQQVRGNDTYTVLTWNGGIAWNDLLCNSTTNGMDCRLEFLSSLHEERSIQAPWTSADMFGLPVILAHGINFRNGSSSDVNLFVSNNGGYNWHQGLVEQNVVQTDMFGSLLVAVFMDKDFVSIKFSLNGGRRWKCLKYSFNNYNPADANVLMNLNSSIAVILVQTLSKAQILTINFTAVVNSTCESKDLHRLNFSANSSHENCFMGGKETFWMLPESSWCLIKDPRIIHRNKSSCACTRNDYECDFGYVEKSRKCVVNGAFKDLALDICQEGEEATCQTTRYRKKLGNSCTGGWNPRDYWPVVYRLSCFDTSDHIASHSKIGSAVVAVIVVIVVIAVVIMAAFFFHKLQQLRRQLPAYRYSKLNQEDQNHVQIGDEDSNETLVDLSSEEEFEPVDQSPAKLLVQSRTVSSPSPPLANGVHPVQKVSEETIKSLLEDTDDELLQ